MNFQAASADFSVQTPSFPSRPGISDRAIRTVNEVHCRTEHEDVSSKSPIGYKDCSRSNEFEEVHDTAVPLTPHCKIQCHMENSESLPVLFPVLHPVQVQSDKTGICTPYFKPSGSPEWPTASQQEASNTITLAPLSRLPRCPPDPLQTTNRDPRTNSHESLHYSQEDFVNGHSLKSDVVSGKGHVRSLAEQFQRLQEVSQRESTHKNEQTVAVGHDQRALKLLQGSFGSSSSLGYRQPIAGSQDNGIWAAEKLNSCLDSRDDLNSVDCFSAHNKFSKRSGSHIEELCSRGKQYAVNPDFHLGRFNHEGEVRQMNDRNPASLVASMPVDCWTDNNKKHYSSQLGCKNTNWLLAPEKEPPTSNQKSFAMDPVHKHPQWNQDTEQEISELESLYQASLQASQASRSVSGRLDHSQHPLGKAGKVICKCYM